MRWVFVGGVNWKKPLRCIGHVAVICSVGAGIYMQHKQLCAGSYEVCVCSFSLVGCFDRLFESQCWMILLIVLTLYPVDCIDPVLARGAICSGLLRFAVAVLMVQGERSINQGSQNLIVTLQLSSISTVWRILTLLHFSNETVFLASTGCFYRYQVDFFRR